MKKIFLLFFLFQSSIYPTISEPLIFILGGGYKEDHLNWKTLTNTPDDVVTYKEGYKTVKYIHLDVFLRGVWRDFLFLVNGGFAPLGRGELEHKLEAFPCNSPAMLDWKTKGHDGAVSALFGYLVNLTPARFNRIILIPEVGYGGYFKRLKTKDRAYYRNKLQQRWYGPFIGGSLRVDTLEGFNLDLIYHFHWLRLYHSSVLVYDNDPYSLCSIRQEQIMVNRAKARSVDGYGHSGGVEGGYCFSKKWRVILFVYYHYFISDQDHIDSTRTNTLYIPVTECVREKLVARWWQIITTLSIGLSF